MIPKQQRLFASIRGYPGNRQKGVVLVLVTIGMLVILGIAGLALDMGRVFLDRTKLQNALDAAALSGAKTLNDGATVIISSDDALATFNLHLEGDLQDANMVPSIEFSETLSPFTPGAVEPNARYIRAKLTNLPVPTSLTSLFPSVGSSLPVSGSAVAGPIPLDDKAGICKLAPILVCGDSGDTDCSNGSCFGYFTPTTGEAELVPETVLKLSTNDSEIGPGNFQLVDFGTGGADVRDGLAGGSDNCSSDEGTIITEPGNTVGPVIQGFNTRFDDYAAGMSEADYPPDHIIREMRYDVYQGEIGIDTNWDTGERGVDDRRVLAVPIADCDGIHTGKTELPILTIGCFFMTKKVSPPPGGEITGEFIGECDVKAVVREIPVEGPASTLYKIVLYKDPDSVDT